MPFGKDISSFAVFPTFLTSSPPFPKRHHRQYENDQVGSADAAIAAKTSLDKSSSSETKRSLRSSHLSSIRCARCGADICYTSQIVSKGFTGRHGRAYLVSPTDSTIGTYTQQQKQKITNTTTMLPNTITQKAVPRQLVTGAHTVADINCVMCGSVLGWKYIAAEEEAQRYKVGKYIIETRRITTSSCWEFEDDFPPSSPDDDGSGLRSSFSSSSSAAAGSFNDKYIDDYNNLDGDAAPPLEFDSQDEDECEDLFTGVWNPSLAKRRRSRKVKRK